MATVERIDRPASDDRQDREKLKAVDLAVGQIEKQFGKGLDHAPRPEGRDPADRRHPHRRHQHRLRARRRRRAARPRHRNLRAGVVGQDDAGAAGHCRGAEARRHGGVRRRRARARRGVRAEARRRSRQPARLAARQRRAGARDRRGPHPLERRRRRRGRLGGGARAEGGNRRRDGRRADGAAGAAHVAGAPQAHRRRLEVEDLPRSSSTSCARRSASCSATPKRRPAAGR